LERQRSQLVPYLHHGRPDVVQELDLRHRLQTARGHADRTAHDGGFRQRCVKAALRAELDLQPSGGFEYPALALDFPQILSPAAIGHILAKDPDAGIAPHLLAQRGVDRVHHRYRIASKMRLRFELVRRGIDLFRVKVGQRRRRRGRRRFQSLLGSFPHLEIDVMHQQLQPVTVQDSLLHQKLGKQQHGIALGLGLALGRSLVKAFVVGKRVRVGPDHTGVHQCRPVTLPAIRRGVLHHTVGGQKIGAIHSLVA